MASSNFKLFDENKSNMMSDTEYAVNGQRLNGVQTGIASSQLQNKSAYQASLMSYALAQLMLQNGVDANDSDAVSTFVNNLSDTVLQKVLDKATTEQAQAGTDNTKYMTPALVKSVTKMTGDTAPTTSTAAAAGMLYIVSGTPATVYMCYGQDSAGNYLWNVVGTAKKVLKSVVFTATQTWTPPSEALLDEPVLIRAFGGGGGGGYKTNTTGGGGGGGHMSVYSGMLTNKAYEITIGDGGSAGSSGGASSFSDLVTANGGAGGNGSIGGAGGTGGGGGGYINNQLGFGGKGSYGGGGGGGSNNSSSSSSSAYGGDAGQYGGGGGCGYNSYGGHGGGYGGNGGSSSNYGGQRYGIAGTDTTGIAGLEFTGHGLGGGLNGTGGGGGGGYGGNGGDSGTYSGGGGGGYGGNGGNGGVGGGGGGGGYGGNGGSSNGSGGGGGGGYGSNGNGGNGGSSTADAGAGGIAAGGGGGNASGNTGSGGSGVVIVYYYAYDI